MISFILSRFSADFLKSQFEEVQGTSRLDSTALTSMLDPIRGICKAQAYFARCEFDYIR
jgi:hypothetical protein